MVGWSIGSKRWRRAVFALVATSGARGCHEPSAAETTEDESTGSTTMEPIGSTTDSSGSTSTDATSTGGIEPPELPVLELGFSPVKQFDFRWAAVVGAEHYELLESAGPGEPFVRLGGNIHGESISIAMPLHLRAEARYVLRACDASDCVESEPVNVEGSLAEAVGYFKASESSTEGRFGRNVALSGDGSTLAVRDDAVYVFERDTLGQWSQQAYAQVPTSGFAIGGESTIALSSDGNTLAVGSTNFGGMGAVFVFTRDAMGQWSQQAAVQAPDPDALDDLDFFGFSVALSADGDTLAVGAIFEGEYQYYPSDVFPAFPGALHVFARDAVGSWSQQTRFEASYPDEGLWLGFSAVLSSDGNTLATTATQGTYVLVRDAMGKWSQQAYYDVSGPLGLSNDGDALVVGAEDGVHSFLRDATDQWSQQLEVIDAPTGGLAGSFGSILTLSGDGKTLAIGTIEEDSDAIGLGGDEGNDSAPGAGAVYVLVRDDVGKWSQRAYVKAPNTDAGDQFGVGIALSSDGKTLAVGAVGEDSTAIGVGGDQTDDSTLEAGAVYLY